MLDIPIKGSKDPWAYLVPIMKMGKRAAHLMLSGYWLSVIKSGVIFMNLSRLVGQALPLQYHGHECESGRFLHAAAGNALQSRLEICSQQIWMYSRIQTRSHDASLKMEYTSF